MKRAIISVSDGSMGYLKASNTYSIPKSTLQDRVRQYRRNGDLDMSVKKGLGCFKPVFSPSQEQNLVDHILTLEQRMFGLTYKDLRQLA